MTGIVEKIEKKIKDAEINNYLDLSNLELVIIPELPQYLKNINYLFINDNKLKDISLTFFENLSVIDLSDNLIEEINYLPLNMHELVCNNCQIRKICFHPTIKKIHCINNKLTHLENYPELEDLQCGNNKLELIPQFLKLKILSCFENPINKIELLPNLKVLNCANTLLEGKIVFCPSLNYLSCENTKITNVSDLDELVELEFNNSQIKELDFLPSLKIIILDDMNIKLSPKYKIKHVVNMGDKLNILLE